MKPIIGRSKFQFERVRVPHGPFCIGSRCLLCEESLHVQQSEVMAVFRTGTEIVALVCDDCLTPEARERLAQIRGEAVSR